MGGKGQYGVDDETVQPQAYLGEEDQLRPSSPLVRGRVKLEVSSPVHSALFKWNSSLVQANSLSKLVAHDSFVCADSSPPSTPAPLPTPSFEATPSGSSFETDPSKGSYDQTPVHIPLSPDPYFMDIEVDVVHDSPVHGDHPTAPASPAAHIPPAPAGHIPPAPAAPIPAAQPQPAPTDPAMIALLELMAEMPQLHSPMPRGRGGRAFRGGRSGGPRPRTPTCFTCGQLGHVRRDCPTVGQFQPAVPSHITCFTCGERGHYATSCPHTHLAQPVVTSAQPVVPVNPPLPLPPAKRQATAGRAYALQLPGPSGPLQGPISVQPQAYLGEEDQLRPSSPLVRGRVKLEVSSPVHSAFFKWNSSLVQASFKTNL
ncbi:hypothetical protein IGI04_036058 [Brassica rapa subsp. trilocularis]|uniref:CCHC-type domain-containing protein n=1 Tax=Brassica rapa subsp. trilocularis TaxID=1813537 RepID=A0ABQ7LDE4_BRACM|nr:hypothetical protein IGI04_036058 [Brassica rapa subsp. trilocularis]